MDTRMDDIGKPDREITIQPLEVPKELPAEPVKTPVKEPVKVPA